MQTSTVPRRTLNSGQLIAVGFALIILIGTFLLWLPFSATGEKLSFVESLFTATSAVCVTGLSVINVSAELSRFGQVVLLCLIQVGGLGFMVFSTLLFVFVGRRITLRDRLLIRESLNTDQLSDLTTLVRWVLVLTLCVEGTGAALLALRFIPMFGLGEGLFMGLFHSVSAFCNAGFDLLGSSSLIEMQSDPLLLFPIMMLITTGGLGFALIGDVFRKRRFSRMTLHTRLVLIMSAALTLSGALFVGLLEWNNPATLGGMDSVWDRLMNALFQSVTLRTAGFATVDQGALLPHTKLLCSLYMFVGASPASTGGGIKVTTFAALLILVGSIARGRENAVLMRRTLPRSLLERAACVFLIALSVVLADIFVLLICEPAQQFIDVMYEAVSAFATVGLSCNMTPSLSLGGRLIIIVTMFIGRVGPLSLALAIAHRQAASKDKLRYPDGNILIG